MEEGQSAAVDDTQLSSDQVKALRDAVKAELAKTQGARDVNTIVLKSAQSQAPVSKVTAESKGFSKPKQD